MKYIVLTVLLACVYICYTAPADNNSKDSNKDSKSIFGPAFDEIVVESSLTVKRKPGGRIARKQNSTSAATVVEDKKIIKRQVGKHHNKNGINPISGGASAAISQSQASNAFGPLGSFGASATGAQTQSFAFGPNGPVGSAGFSGTQQYRINGQTVDIAFGNAFSGAQGANGNAGGAAITVTGADGVKRPLNG